MSTGQVVLKVQRGHYMILMAMQRRRNRWPLMVETISVSALNKLYLPVPTLSPLGDEECQRRALPKQECNEGGLEYDKMGYNNDEMSLVKDQNSLLDETATLVAAAVVIENPLPLHSV